MGNGLAFTFSNFQDNHRKNGGKPIYFRLWQSKGNHTLSDAINDKGLRSFQDLQKSFQFTWVIFLVLSVIMYFYALIWSIMVPSKSS